VSVGLACVALITAVAASGSARQQGASDAAQLRIGLVLPPLTNQTINDIYLGAKARAAQTHVSLMEGGGVQTPVWMNACENIISAKVDVLVYDSLDAQGTSKCVEDANKANIKVVCLFACTAKGKNDVTITLNFRGDGLAIGKWMAGAVGPSGKVALLRGPLGDQAILAVEKGFLDAVKANCPGCSVVADVPGGNDRNSGYTAALQVLTAHPDVNGMYCANDDIALGCLKAIQQNGDAGKIKLAGHNGTCDALASLLSSNGLNFTIMIAGQPFGTAVVDTAAKLFKGQPVTKTQYVTPFAIDSKTAQAILSGSRKNPPNLDVRAKLAQAKKGC
jgi:ribose transport system substrate-binding protein